MAWYRRVGSDHRPTGYESVALPLSYTGILAFLLCSNEEGSGGRITSQHQELIVLIRSPVINPAGGWYTLTDLNRRPSGCKPEALPTELSVHMVELTSSAPRVQPIIHIKKYLHDSQLGTDSQH